MEEKTGKLIEAEFCCEDFQNWWIFGDTVTMFMDENFYRMVIIEKGEPQKINFCPFCGKKLDERKIN